MTRISVRVPASSANLGPGFDSFGLAIGLYNRFSAIAADAWHVDVAGEGVGVLATDDTNRVAVAMARLFVEIGEAGRAAHITCENAVPPGQGLGSSSAAIVGGLLLANGLAGAGLPDDELLRLATELEGHPDNVAAALFGGLTLCWDDDGPSCAALQPGGGIAVVVVPGVDPLATVSSRALLPASVPHAAAAFNAGRAGVLVAGLLIGDPDLTEAGLQDRIHQSYRSSAIADFEEVRQALLSSGADGAALSGAGPTVVGIVQDEDDEAALERARHIAARAALPLASSVSRLAPVALPVDREGAGLV